MRRSLAVKLSVFWLAVWIFGTALTAAPSLRSMGNAYYEVVGLDLRSVTYVNELSLYAAQTAERYLDRAGLAFPMPILVSLRPEAHANFEGDYRLRMGARGTVELEIRWEDGMTLERTCHALAEALLAQYAVYNHGPEAVQTLRRWPVDALAKEIYFGLRPAEFISLVNELRLSEAPGLPAIVQPGLSDPSEVEPAYDYCLLEMLKAALDRKVVRSLFQQAVAGIDIEAALAAAVQPQEPTAESLAVEDWWQARLAALLGREYEVVETMAVSREWLATLARFDAPLKVESEEFRLNLRSLWTHREQPEVREWIEARYEILRLRMARLNPAYYNPARSLGVLFEALLRDAPAHEYLHALAIYLSDYEDAKDMQEAIEEKLGQN